MDENGAPLFRVDSFWPGPLPNRWSMQEVTGIHVDHMDIIWFADRDGFAWVGGTQTQDSILKFTRDGELVWDFDHRPPGGTTLEENNQQVDVLAEKGRFQLDEDEREIYIINWKRVLVFDMDTGEFKRGWGGQGDPVAPPCGRVYALAFSMDPEQKYLYMADGTNSRVWIVDRKSGETLGSFGGTGRYAGQFHWVNAIATDSVGNIYTGEVKHGKRIRKFEPIWQ